MPPIKRKAGAVSDIARPVRRAVLSSSASVSDEIINELRSSVGTAPVAEAANELFEARLEPVHPLDSWTTAVRPAEQHAPARSRLVTFFSLAPWIIGAGVVIAGLLYISEYGLQLKGRVVRQGNAAISSLMSAKSDLENFDIQAAQGDFSAAAEQFGRASREMGALGPGILGIVSKVPGLKSLSYGHDLVQAGALISDAGKVVTEALSSVGQAGGILDPKSTDLAVGQIIVPLKDALAKADKDISQAAELVNGVPEDALPDNIREQFVQFKNKLPELQELLSRGDQAVAFISGLTGIDAPKRYLLLFQNSSELRPTGGFPGSYGLMTFESGRMKDMHTDDIYNPDGQIKDVTVPPLQLQGITPDWGMRDSTWFIDFPVSAKKAMEFYRRGGGAAVDGVIAIRPDVVMEILKVTGPISLPKYDKIITADNFLPTIQLEVESQNSPQPKQIIMDLAPLLMQRVASLPVPEWLKVVQVVNRGLAGRDVMMYFADREMQGFVTAQKWDGGVRQTPGDYLMIDVANIRGAKADAVTGNSAKLESWLENGTMVHRLTFTRQHNGGNTPYGFYNKTNYSYVRVLVPEGSTLRGINGNDRQSVRPLMDYKDIQARTDPDLAALERTYSYDASNGATTYEESGKTGFGFWMKVEPGKTQQVQLEYIVPAKYAASDYRLYIQRQSGLDFSDFELSFLQRGGLIISSGAPALVAWPDSWRLHDRLGQDLEVSLQLK